MIAENPSPPSLSSEKTNDLLRYEKLLTIRDYRVEFATEHHRNTRGEKMDFTSSPHARDWYNSISPDIVIMGSVQIYKSEFLLIDTLACAAAGLAVFFVLPKTDLKISYIQNRVNRAIERSPYYRKLLGKGSFDNTVLKQFGDGVIKYVGSNALADFREFPGDVTSIEEVDECDAENLPLATDRVRSSIYQFKRAVGNPSESNKGIHALFLKTDQRELHVPCPTCEKMVKLDWFETVVEPLYDKEGAVYSYAIRDKEWYPGIKRDIKPCCPACYAKDVFSPIDRLDPRAKWIPSAPQNLPEGYHVSMMSSSMNSISSMYEAFIEGVNNPTKMQLFYNSYLGLPFQALGCKLSENLLLKCSEIDPYEFVIDGTRAYVADNSVYKKEGQVSMGIDVGANFDIRISHVDGKSRRKALFIGKVRNVEDVIELIKEYGVAAAVIDSMPETRISQEIQEKCFDMGVDCWLCRYDGEGDDKKIKKDTANKIIKVDRTLALDESFFKLRTGKNLVPTNFNEICNGEFLSEMIGPTRMAEKDTRGNYRNVWMPCKDHQRHADTYDMIAANLLLSSTLTEAFVV